MQLGTGEVGQGGERIAAVRARRDHSGRATSRRPRRRPDGGKGWLILRPLLRDRLADFTPPGTRFVPIKGAVRRYDSPSLDIALARRASRPISDATQAACEDVLNHALNDLSVVTTVERTAQERLMNSHDRWHGDSSTRGSRSHRLPGADTGAVPNPVERGAARRAPRYST